MAVPVSYLLVLNNINLIRINKESQGAPIPWPNGPLLLMMIGPSSSKARVISVV
jgi:hypothetical protein